LSIYRLTQWSSSSPRGSDGGTRSIAHWNVTPEPALTEFQEMALRDATEMAEIPCEKPDSTVNVRGCPAGSIHDSVTLQPPVLLRARSKLMGPRVALDYLYVLLWKHPRRRGVRKT
jgi:hypothetical protein